MKAIVRVPIQTSKDGGPAEHIDFDNTDPLTFESPGFGVTYERQSVDHLPVLVLHFISENKKIVHRQRFPAKGTGIVLES